MMNFLKAIVIAALLFLVGCANTDIEPSSDQLFDVPSGHYGYYGYHVHYGSEIEPTVFVVIGGAYGATINMHAALMFTGIGVIVALLYLALSAHGRKSF
jgi:hypothetical protein